jgi:hypothetical protein
VSLAGFTSIAVDAGGRRHISYEGVGNLWYATCLSSCADPANWQMLPVDVTAVTGDYSSLAVDVNGVRHISYFDASASNYDLKYARCARNCGTAAGWGLVTVDKGSGATGTDVGQYTSLAVGGDGRVHVSYWDQTAGRLKYASCGADCLQAASWSRQAVDGGCTYSLVCTDVGQFTSLQLNGGTVHVSYFDDTHRDLRYAELAP